MRQAHAQYLINFCPKDVLLDDWNPLLVMLLLEREISDSMMKTLFYCNIVVKKIVFPLENTAFCLSDYILVTRIELFT